MSNVRVIVNFCMSGMFDRYPNVKISSAESGIGWIPFILEAMEYQLDEMVTDGRGESGAASGGRPSTSATISMSRSGSRRSDPPRPSRTSASHNVFVETDIPHPTCIYPERQAADRRGHEPNSIPTPAGGSCRTTRSRPTA